MTIAADLERQLQDKALKALSFWGISTTPVLLKYRENAVFKVSLPNGKPAALRLHRPNYHERATLQAELDFSAYLAANKMAVPQPIPALDGALCVESDAGNRQFASLISWMDGRPLGQTGVPLDLSPREAGRVFERLGRLFAEFHALADSYPHPDTFNRPSWDMAGLIGEAPLWGRFWDCPGLTNDQAEGLSALRQRLLAHSFDLQASPLDYGLIHADGVRENIMITEKSVGLIDFDDFGYGYRVFELATALYKNRQEPSYADLEAALLNGYGSVRSLPANIRQLLNFFTMLRSLTYIGWAAERPEVASKVPRYALEALTLADTLL
mgnify:CR=1 FL=1